MSKFAQKHPALADAADSVVSLLSGAFSLVAVAGAWIAEVWKRREEKGKKSGGHGRNHE